MRQEDIDSRTIAWETRVQFENVIEFEFHGFNKDKYQCFSSFILSPILIDEKLWPSPNHYYQAMKFSSFDYQEQIREQPTPYHASFLGKSRKVQIRADLEEVKYSIMLKAVTAKFRQYPDYLQVLLSTQQLPIVCHNPEDGFWGDGLGCGCEHLNSLGKILMHIRDTLRLEL